jgi:hypothetical protein
MVHRHEIIQAVRLHLRLLLGHWVLAPVVRVGGLLFASSYLLLGWVASLISNGWRRVSEGSVSTAGIVATVIYS